jgi:hypothetical protein
MLPETRLEHVTDERRANRGIETEPARLCTLKADPGERHERERECRSREDRPQRPPHRPRLVREDVGEPDRPPGAEEDEREREEAHQGEPEVDRRRSALLAQHLARDTGGTGLRLTDVENVGAAHRMRVGRHNPPCDGIRVAGQIRAKADRDRVWLRPSRPAFVHAPGGTVVHANGAEGGLHRLVEAQHDPARSTGEHLVVRRRRRDEDRVRRRRRRGE